MGEYKPQNVSATVLTPFQKFINIQALSGIVLLSCSVLALLLANSAIAGKYTDFWQTRIGFTIGSLRVHHSLHQWINDGLMTIFFFVVGLEIKRELLSGELSSAQKRILPLAAAIGGAIMPALLYTAFNYAGPGRNGWGIPMATDIAFVLGIVTLMGKRVPPSVKVFILAFAIIDDLIAILVIAVFYTDQIDILSLFRGGGLFLVAIIIRAAGFYNTLLFLMIGAAGWFAFQNAGIHPTISGVIMAMTIPTLPKTGKREYAGKVAALLADLNRIEGETKSEKKQQREIIDGIEELSATAKSPLYKLEHFLHPVSSFVIMPLFALANAGISIDQNIFRSLAHPISLGVIVALFVGKQIGIFSFIWLSVKLNIAVLPADTGWRKVWALSCLGGMGFTLSLFIAVLAFQDMERLGYAKVGVLAGSLISIGAGMALFMSDGKGRQKKKQIAAGPPE